MDRTGLAQAVIRAAAVLSLALRDRPATRGGYRIIMNDLYGKQIMDDPNATSRSPGRAPRVE